MLRRKGDADPSLSSRHPRPQVGEPPAQVGEPPAPGPTKQQSNKTKPKTEKKKEKIERNKQHRMSVKADATVSRAPLTPSPANHGIRLPGKSMLLAPQSQFTKNPPVQQGQKKYQKRIGRSDQGSRHPRKDKLGQSRRGHCSRFSTRTTRGWHVGARSIYQTTPGTKTRCGSNLSLHTPLFSTTKPDNSSTILSVFVTKDN